MRDLRTLRILAASAALSLAVAGLARSGPGLVDGISRAPGFELPGRNGPVSSDGLRDHLVYVDFWASWCGPCQLSFPWMRELHDRYAKQGLVIVAIDLDKDRVAADRFLDRHPSPFLVAYDPAGETARAFGVSAMPSSYLVGADGTLLRSIAGFDSDQRAQVEALITKVLPR